MSEVDVYALAQQVPKGSAVQSLPDCDLVMKGGIMSGIVYPGTAIALAGRYRFRNIGGTSAGAIAAGVVAAAEYGRQGNGDGFVGLGRMIKQLETADFGASLFQAGPAGRPLLELALAATKAGRDGPASGRTAARRAVIGALKRQPWSALPLALALVAVVAGGWAMLDAWPPGWGILWLVLFGVPATLVAAVLVAGLALGLPLVRALRSARAAGWGLCPGTQQDGYAGPGLMDWLHQQIQDCAGLPHDTPLTFGMLRERGISLELMTTDLSATRPVRCPEGLAAYRFAPATLEGRVPAAIVTAVREAAGQSGAESSTPLELAPDDIPVLLAIRLSLSFPGLLSVVELHDPRTQRTAVFSDGGISSNFPIHFFDAWFPSRPTFGIDLAEHPSAGAPAIGSRDAPPPPRWSDIDSAGAFVSRIFDTARNWRDTLQAELPGYRDRVCQVPLQPGEGGLNLNMPPEAVSRLVQRGYQAGALLSERLPMAPPGDGATPQWNGHVLDRFSLLMRTVQPGLASVCQNGSSFITELAQGLPPLPPTQLSWPFTTLTAEQASAAVEPVLAAAGTWGPDGTVDFAAPPPPVPDVTMRVVPAV